MNGSRKNPGRQNKTLKLTHHLIRSLNIGSSLWWRILKISAHEVIISQYYYVCPFIRLYKMFLQTHNFTLHGLSGEQNNIFLWKFLSIYFALQVKILFIFFCSSLSSRTTFLLSCTVSLCATFLFPNILNSSVYLFFCPVIIHTGHMHPSMSSAGKRWKGRSEGWGSKDKWERVMMSAKLWFFFFCKRDEDEGRYVCS